MFLKTVEFFQQTKYIRIDRKNSKKLRTYSFPEKYAKNPESEVTFFSLDKRKWPYFFDFWLVFEKLRLKVQISLNGQRVPKSHCFVKSSLDHQIEHECPNKYILIQFLKTISKLWILAEICYPDLEAWLNYVERKKLLKKHVYHTWIRRWVLSGYTSRDASYLFLVLWTHLYNFHKINLP